MKTTRRAFARRAFARRTFARRTFARRAFARRAFLGTAAALALPGGRTGFAQSSEGTSGLAMGTYGLPDFELLDAIELIGKTGFDAIEITVFPGTSGDPDGALESAETRQKVADAIARSGLRLCALMADMKPETSDEKHAEQLEDLRKLVKLAKDLSPENPPLIQTTLGGKEWEDSRSLFLDRVSDWTQLLGDWKGRLAIKPHRGNAMSTPAHAAELLAGLGNPKRLGMVYDYSHYAFREPILTIAETVATALPITTYVAVKDAVMQEEKVRFALPGTTDSWDQADVLRAFSEGGYRGDFCCEVSSQVWRGDPDYDPVAATRLSHEKMADAFARASVARG